MKHKNLQILKSNNINVPAFYIVERTTKVDSVVANLSDDILYAVRSSFSVEDDKTKSFAGQFKTILNVKKNDVKDAVNKVFASAANQNVKDYAASDDQIDGCVIVQEMIQSQISGIIFTSNPLGILNESVITVCYGLGNSLMSDNVQSASYFYNNDDLLYYREGTDEAPHLDEKTIKSLIEVSSKIKGLFQTAVDIEFAIQNDEIYILQTRPITTIKNKQIVVLDNSNIVESYPGLSLPLTQDFAKEVYHEIFYTLIARISKSKKTADRLDKNLQNMVDSANWRLYYRISNWYDVLRLLPSSNKIIPMWQKMMGVSNIELPPPQTKAKLIEKTRITSSFFSYLHQAPRMMKWLNDRFIKKYPEYRQSVEKENELLDLLVVYDELKADILSNWDITLINDMYTFVYTALAGKENKGHLADVKNLESMKPTLAMDELIRTARTKGFDSKEYLYKFNEYIELYGDRCLGELKLETHTYRTHPELLTNYIKQNINLPDSIYDEPEEIKESKNLKKAKLGIRNREISRLNRSRLFGISRSIFRKMGSILAAEGRLDNEDDIFYLRMKELEQAALKDYGEPDIDLKSIVNERKIEEEHMKTIPAYSRLVFDGKIINKQSVTQYEVLNDNNHLVGTPTSTGETRGEILVIKDPDISIDTTDKIIVTESTDPGWIFLVKNAKGIIAERGSLLSHTAIISRELHKPAIVNVKDCTKILKDGDCVSMNAETGKIEILRRST